jgi:sugar/nucleoside kinase (ribokinase family)
MIRHYNVITVGESTIDAFMTLEHANTSFLFDERTKQLSFRHGEKIDVARYDFTIGGNATNVAVGLTRRGLKATLCSETGDDEFSIKIRNCLASEHIERLFVNQTRGASNFSVIINYKGDRTIFVQDVTREHDFKLEDVTADFIYLTSLGRDWENPYLMVLDFVSKNKTTKLAFNPGSLQLHEGKDIIKKILKKTHIVFVNKEEAEIILTNEETEKDDKEYIQTLMTRLQKIGPRFVVLTNGKKGSYVLDDSGKFYWHGINDGKVVERTGAGDAYTSGFLAASLYSMSVPKAMQWGAYNATSVVGQIGAQAGLLRKEEIEDLIGK